MGKLKRWDFHSHILPGIDDGAKDEDTSVGMFCSLMEEGVEVVCFTPHYTPHRESLQHFLHRRQVAYEKFRDKLCIMQDRGDISGTLPGIKMGAEIYVEPDLIEEDHIRRLCYTETDALLLELPFAKLDRRIYETVENIALKYSVIPVLAHLERYRKIFTKEQMERVLGIPNVVVQINAESFRTLSGRRFALSLAKQGVPVILGSDCHDMKYRLPQIEKAYKFMESKLKGQSLADFYRAAEFVLGE